MPLNVSILATLATLQTRASLLPIAPKVSCFWDNGFLAHSPNRVITSSASSCGLRPNGSPRWGACLLCANGGCSPRFACICYSQLSKQTGFNCCAYHSPPSPAVLPTFAGNGNIMRNLNSGRKGKIPQWGRAGGLYLSPSEYQTDSSAPSCKRRGGPFPGLWRGVWGACAGCRAYFPSLHRVEGA